MGQGLMTKLALVASNEFGLNYENIKISSTDTEKVPNTSASAASATTDINGAAIVNAINNIKSGLNEFIYDYFKTNSKICLLYTSPSPRDATLSRMPSSA